MVLQFKCRLSPYAVAVRHLLAKGEFNFAQMFLANSPLNGMDISVAAWLDWDTLFYRLAGRYARTLSDRHSS